MGRTIAHSSSPSSSIHSSVSSSSSCFQPQTDLSTELTLGRGGGTSTCDHKSSVRNESLKPFPKNMLCQRIPSFFVKVYMDGIPIGRKVDLFSHCDYDSLVRTLHRMFKTAIHSPNVDLQHSDKDHLLIYEDEDGDWMMVGDVPWNLFLTTVKKLKITRAGKF
ncbi:hypothetical protein ACHQM5_013171 [Ranunculus cassubicifolius]